MPAPIFRGVGAKAAGTGSVQPALPTGVAIGDICVLIASTISGGSISITANGGGAWTAVTGSPIDCTNGEKLYVWWRRHASGDSAPTVQPGSDHICACVAAWYNCIGSDSPVDISETGYENTSDTSFSFATTVSTTINNCLVLVICTSGQDSNTGQFPNAFTNANLTSIATRANYNTSSGGGGGFGLAEGLLAVAGAIGTWATTLSNASTKAYITFALKPPPPVSISDSGSGSDSLAIKKQSLIIDSGSGLDSLSLINRLPIIDSGAGADILSLIIQLVAADSGIGVDDISISTGAMPVQVSDSGSGIDSISLKNSLLISDSGIGSELLFLFNQLLIADTGQGTDLISLLAKLSTLDSGFGSDAVAILRKIVQSDIGNGFDVIALFNKIPILDSGFGLDQISINFGATPIQINDFGIGTDTLSLINRLLISESGSGIDLVILKLFKDISDSGLGLDQVSVVPGGIIISDSGQGTESIIIIRAGKKSIARFFSKITGAISFQSPPTVPGQPLPKKPGKDSIIVIRKK